MQYEIKIDSMAFRGYGVGRINGKVCFVPGTIPGENILVDVYAEKKNYVSGRLLQVLTPSPSRIEAVCPLAVRPVGKFGKSTRLYCPGCSYQHLDYQEEVKVKEQQFNELLVRIADVEPGVVLSPLSGDQSYNYRNKLTLHVSIEKGEVALGYYANNNTTILDIIDCPLAKNEINDTLRELKTNKGFAHSLHDGMTFTLRSTENDGIVYWRNRVGKNKTWLKEVIGSESVAVPRESFYQINSWGCDTLYKLVTDTLQKYRPTTVIDLYCGVGVFSIAALSSGVGKAVGIDQDPEAVKAAQFNCRQFERSSYVFHAGKSSKMIIKALRDNEPKNTVLIVDPPRGGIDGKTLKTIERSGIRTIIYISCAPDTLARDVSILTGSGYRLRTAQVVDMFPRTAHFESFNVLELGH